MFRNAKQLRGYRLGALDGEIGKVKDFFFDDQSWTIRYLVADTGNWLPGRQVLLSPYAVEAANDEDKVVRVQLTKKQIEDSPPITADMPVSRKYEVEYHQYYGWPAYWYGPELWGPAPYPLFQNSAYGGRRQVLEDVEEGDPHLRGVEEVLGYHIHALDGQIGHVEDFIIDDENWAMRYMEIDTRNWWPGKKVLIAPQWIERVSWEESAVFVSLRRETIKAAPEYQPDAGINREFEKRLYAFYDRAGYWEREEELAGHRH